MSDLQAVALTGEVALSAATAKTVLQLTAPTNHRVKILGYGVFFDGTSTTAEPVEVVLQRQSTAGTMTSLTPAKLDDSLAETLQSTAQHTATAEPTSVSNGTLDVIEVHPQQGYEKLYPLGQEPIIGGGDRVGIICTAPATVNVRAKLIFEE